MKISIHQTLSGPDLQAYQDFLWSAAHQHPRQDPRFESSDVADGLAVRYVFGRIDGQIRAVALFTLRPHPWIKGAFAEAISLGGPVCDDAGEMVAFVEAVRRAPEFARVGVVRITPYWLDGAAQALRDALAAAAGWTPFESDAYRQTGLVDLTPTTEGLMTTFSTTARRKIRKCEREGITFNYCTDEAEALDFLERLNKMRVSRGLSLVKEAGFMASFRDVYRHADIGVLIIARHQGHFVAGNQSFRSTRTAHLGHFCTDEIRLRAAGDLRIAPISCLQEMKWASAKGCRVYDLEGYREDAAADDRLYNIYKYKAEFHPSPAQRMPGHGRVVNRFLYVTGNARDIVKPHVKAVLKRLSRKPVKVSKPHE